MLKHLKKNSLVLGLFSLCLLLLLTTSLSAVDRHTLQPQAIQGSMNLSQWNFAEQGPVNLRGEWALYWKLLLNPSQVKNFDSLRVYHTLPDSWADQTLANQQLTNEGYATYRLVINLDSLHPTEMALKIPLIYTSYKLWVNDKLVAAKGLVGTSRAETKAQGLPQIVFFTPDNNQVEMVLQISNYNHATGGIWTDFYFGTPAQIMDQRDRNMLMQMLLFGSLGIMGIYYLGLFAFRRGDRSNLYFAVFCLLNAARILFVGEMLFIKWFPDLEWELAKKLEFLAFHLSLPFFSLLLLELYPLETSRRINSIIIGFSLVFIGIDLFAPARVFTVANTSYQLLVVCSSFYLYGVLIRASWHHRLGAVYSLAGGLFLLLTMINDMLYYNEMFNLGSDLAAIGLLVFIFSQSIILSMRLSHAFTHNERLTVQNTAMLGKIIDLNQTLEERIQERTNKLSETVAQLNMEIIERKEAEEKLTLYATTDIMTGLANRATGMNTLNSQLALAKRNNWHLTVGFIDIDNLKVVNDQYGHQVGDDLIVNISKILKNQLRVSDTVSRIGGDEFLVIFPDCPLSEAEVVWQRVEGAITEFNHTKQKPYQISLSSGFAEFSPGEEIAAEKLVEIADSQMYRVKKPNKY